jgi:cytochrome b subunit of formate dehydrogenase
VNRWRIAHNITASAVVLATVTGMVLFLDLSRSEERLLAILHAWIAVTIVPALGFQLIAGTRLLLHPDWGRPLLQRLNGLFARFLLIAVIALTLTGLPLLFDGFVRPVTRSRFELLHRALTDLFLPVFAAHICSILLIRFVFGRFSHAHGTDSRGSD